MGTLENDDEKPGQFVCSTNILVTILQENKLTVHICKVLLQIKCNLIEHSSVSAFDGHRLINLIVKTNLWSKNQCLKVFRHELSYSVNIE